MSSMLTEPEAVCVAPKQSEEVVKLETVEECHQIIAAVPVEQMDMTPSVAEDIVKTEIEAEDDNTRNSATEDASESNPIEVQQEPDGQDSGAEANEVLHDEPDDDKEETESSGVVLRSKRTRKLPKPQDSNETGDVENDSRGPLSRSRHAFKSKTANKQMLAKKRSHLWSRMPHRKFTRSTGSVLALRKKQQQASLKKSQQGTRCKKTIHGQSEFLKLKATESYGYLRLPERVTRSKQSIVTRSMKLQLLMENLEDMRRIELQNLKNVKKLCNHSSRRTAGASEIINPQIHQIVKSTVTQCEEVIRRIDRLVTTMRRLQHHGIRLCSKLKFVPGQAKSSGKSTKVAEIRKKFVEQLCINN